MKEKRTNEHFSEDSKQIKIDFNLFNKFLKQAEIGSTELLLRWTYTLLPYWYKILEELQKVVTREIEQLWYDKIKLPQIISNKYVSHLQKEWLFHTWNENHDFFLVSWYEILAAVTFLENNESLNQLPVKYYNIADVFRQIPKTRFLKNMEFNICEINSFRHTDNEAQEEKILLNDKFKEVLNKLKIKYIEINDSLWKKWQLKIYCYFPFLKKFWWIFCTKATDNEYFKNIKWHEHDEIYQVNASFTERILSLYLWTHMDKRGFILDKKIAPYQIYINQKDFSEEILNNLKQDLYDLDLKYLIKDIRGNQQNYDYFNAKGIPINIWAWSHQLKIRSRAQNDVQRMDINNIKENIYNTITNYELEFKNNFEFINMTENLKIEEYKENVVYIYPSNIELNLKDTWLKKLWYIDEHNLAYVKWII